VKKHKPTARHRDIAEFILNLPIGKHLIDVREDWKAALKPEGGMMLNHDDKTITVVPDGLGGFKRVART
jgi:hypothetical protein